MKQPTENLIRLRSRGEPNSGQVKMHVLFLNVFEQIRLFTLGTIYLRESPLDIMQDHKRSSSWPFDALTCHS